MRTIDEGDREIKRLTADRDLHRDRCQGWSDTVDKLYAEIETMKEDRPPTNEWITVESLPLPEDAVEIRVRIPARGDDEPEMSKTYSVQHQVAVEVLLESIPLAWLQYRTEPKMVTLYWWEDQDGEIVAAENPDPTIEVNLPITIPDPRTQEKGDG